MTLLTLALLMPIAGGCTSGGDEPVPAGKSDIVLSVALVTGTSTRADDLGHPETDGEYLAFEEGIDLNDTGIFLYGAVSSTDDPRLISGAILDGTIPKNITLTGSPGNYTLQLTLPKRTLREALGLEDEEDMPSDLSLRMLILSNCTPTDNSFTLSSLTDNAYSATIGNLKDWAYNMSDIYDATSDATAIELLYGTPKPSAPLFGTITRRVSTSALEDSGPLEHLDLGSISLLRAVAKIRVVDNISAKKNGYPQLTDVTFRGKQESLRVVPADAENYVNGSQVHTANIFDPTLNAVTYATSFRLGEMPDKWNMTPDSERTGKTFVAYVPEQAINSADAASGPVPALHITVDFGPDKEGNDDIRSYTVPMSRYGNTPFEFGDYILRNHIYTLAVTGISNGEMAVKARVVPWLTERDHTDL